MQLKIVFGYLTAGWFLLSGAGCKKYLEVPLPVDQLTQGSVYSDARTIDATVTGLYSFAFNESTPFSYGTDLYMGLMSDEFHYQDNTYDEFTNNGYTVNSYTVSGFWSDNYKIIYHANDIIENLAATKIITPAQRQHYIGEAKFFRAFSHFELTNLFGRVPLILTTDVTKTAFAPQVSTDSIYQQVIIDLQDADTALASSSNGKTRVTSLAAEALLARVYLYAKNWEKAESLATRLIGSGTIQLETDLNRVFLRNSQESILQASTDQSIPGITGFTLFGSFLLPFNGNPYAYFIDSSLLNAFEPGDGRASSWIGSAVQNGQTIYYPYKYKQISGPANPDDAEDFVLLRLGEQYLIRAEARARKNNIQGSVDDLNVLRERAGLSDIPSSLSPTALLAAVEQERKVELFLEFGHRWFDLVRTARADAVLGALKPTWRSTAQLLPVPFTEIRQNPNLVQNPGY